MINTSAVGVAVLMLIAATAMVESSSADHDFVFQRSQSTLADRLTRVDWQGMMRSYQRQVHTISLSQAHRDSPHWLEIESPTGTTLRGELTINNTVQLTLEGSSTQVDLSPYLQQPTTEVLVTGTYDADAPPAMIRFKGPDTLVQQHITDGGDINFQLNLVLE